MRRSSSYPLRDGKSAKASFARATTVGLVGAVCVAVGCTSMEDVSPVNNAENGTAKPASIPASGGSPVEPTFQDTRPLTETTACVANSVPAGVPPLALIFAIDRSGSMIKDRSNRWNAAADAVRSFLNSPAIRGVHASLTFFPLNGDTKESCVKAPYVEPQVSMRAAPNEAFANALKSEAPSRSDQHWFTPMRDALEGAMDYAERVASDLASPASGSFRGTRAIVLVTDGLPNGCEDAEKFDRVTAIAKRGLPSVRTYVIGVGDQLEKLNDLAEAGGTRKANLVADNGVAALESKIKEALEAIRGNATECSYAIPAPPDGKTFDRNKVNVSVSKKDSKTNLLHNATCAGGTGWSFDNPSNPRTIRLCEATCNDAQKADATINVLFGCETQTGPVR